jgi:hypothetical protein
VAPVQVPCPLLYSSDSHRIQSSDSSIGHRVSEIYPLHALEARLAGSVVPSSPCLKADQPILTARVGLCPFITSTSTSTTTCFRLIVLFFMATADHAILASAEPAHPSQPSPSQGARGPWSGAPSSPPVSSPSPALLVLRPLLNSFSAQRAAWDHQGPAGRHITFVSLRSPLALVSIPDIHKTRRSPTHRAKGQRNYLSLRWEKVVAYTYAG